MPGCPIRKSPDQSLFDSSPGHIAAYHVLHRLSIPRHPPCTLSSLITLITDCHTPPKNPRKRKSHCDTQQALTNTAKPTSSALHSHTAQHGISRTNPSLSRATQCQIWIKIHLNHCLSAPERPCHGGNRDYDGPTDSTIASSIAKEHTQKQRSGCPAHAVGKGDGIRSPSRVKGLAKKKSRKNPRSLAPDHCGALGRYQDSISPCYCSTLATSVDSNVFSPG